MVECGRCKQLIIGDSLGLDKEKMKKINFPCRACVEGERWEQEAREGKKRQWMGQISKKGRENRRYENGEKRCREKWESGKKEYKGLKKRGQKRVKDVQEADRAEEFPGKRGRVEVETGENDKEQRGGRRERKRSNRGG